MEFARLAEAEQVARLRQLADRALRCWDCEQPNVDLIKYRENAVFSVRTGEGERWVLRVHRPRYRSDEAIRSEFAWMQALQASGIHTPRVLTTRDGDLLTVTQGEGVPEARQCDVMLWIDGSPPGSLEYGVPDAAAVRDLYRTVGELAARMHEHGAAWARPLSFVRPTWDIEALIGDRPTFGRFWELDGLDDLPRQVLLAARDRARERLRDLGDCTLLVHGDLVPDNLLVDGAHVRVIDFDDCGWSWPGFEMATSLFPLQVSGGLEDGIAGYLEGYRSVRRFPAADLERFPDLLLARGLSYLGWPVGRPEIESVRKLVPFMIAMMTTAAEGYLRRP